MLGNSKPNFSDRLGGATKRDRCGYPEFARTRGDRKLCDLYAPLEASGLCAIGNELASRANTVKQKITVCSDRYTYMADTRQATDC